MSDWHSIYLKQIEKNGQHEKYIKTKVNQKRKLVKLLIKHSGDGKVIEAGCGTGIISAHLARKGLNVLGVDMDSKVLGLAKDLEQKYYGDSCVKFKKQSIFELNYKENNFDLCYSVGVLEHFADEEIINSLSQQIKIAKKTVVVIPTKWFKDSEALHGDDRFLKLSYWRELISQSGGKVIEEASYSFKGKGFTIFDHIKRMFKPKAYRIFVISKKDD